MPDKKKVLIIDDEERFGQMVKVNLELTGNYDVFVEVCGSKGLATARSVKPDIILLDVIMPDMSGPDVASQLRNDENTKSIPILFLTAMPKDSVYIENSLQGNYRFLPKPVSSAELIKHIESNLIR